MASDDDIKALLLEDYKHCAAGLAKSEQAGESRLTFFVGLVTFCASAVGAGYAKADIAGRIDMRLVALAAASALLIIGVVIFLRMITRNENTDLAKRQLDLIRQTFKDYFDGRGILTRYDLFPESRGRRFGSLTHLISVVNAILAAGVVFLLYGYCKEPGIVGKGFIAVVAFFATVVGQYEYVRSRERQYKGVLKSHFLQFTHAGGVVYSISKGVASFLVVRPSDEKKDEWVLPKGHIDGNEMPNEAALREVGEEARVFAKIVGPLGTTEYKNESLTLRTKFYLMEKIGDVEMLHPEKVRKVRWVPGAEAVELLTFDESKNIMRRAIEMIH